jgi:hypothetical protein
MMSKVNSVKACQNPRCLGNYNFDHIADFARKRFVEGFDTVTLLQRAESETQKQEIALVCMLDIEDDEIKDLKLDCVHDADCKVTNCRSRLKKMIQQDLKAKNKH